MKIILKEKQVSGNTHDGEGLNDRFVQLVQEIRPEENIIFYVQYTSMEGESDAKYFYNIQWNEHLEYQDALADFEQLTWQNFQDVNS